MASQESPRTVQEEEVAWQMPVQEVDGYHVGQRGWIDVLDSEGKQKRWVEGEIVRLIPAPENIVYAMIRTRMGTGVYRVW